MAEMKRSILRPVATVTVLVVTVTAFVYYFSTHETVRTQLRSTPPLALAIIVALYLLSIMAIAGTFWATLRLCKLRLSGEESLLVTAYSAVVNFFGPLQSGPAFRAVYLKKRYDVNLKNFGAATLMYYFFYGGFSVLFLLFGLLHWWLLALAALGLLAMFGLQRVKPVARRIEKLDVHGWYYLAAATFLQVACISLIYFTELKSVAPETTYAQAIVYTGAANLAMFVSLTPGAIGFRETFLLFSQHLHHISNATIVSANILDRAMYIVVLALMGLFIFGTHAKRQLTDVTRNTEPYS